MHLPLAFCYLLAHITTSLARSPDEWRGRSIYQILTDRFARTDNNLTSPCDVSKNEYCGGTWKGIEQKLEYIYDMGFNAIWISPITKNIPTGYHGYYQTDLYALNENFGTEQDLKDLSDALHERDMYLMVDIVTNHFGSVENDPSVDYSQYYPFDDESYFHPYCEIDYDNQTSAEICWLYSNLPDVRTEDQNVIDAYSTWISQLVANYSIDGLRIDSVKNVNKASMPPFCEAAGVYCLGELSNNDPDYSYPYQQVLNGGGIINYPLYFSFNETFIYNGFSSTEKLAYNIYLDRNNSIDSNFHGTFTENHDNPRIACHNPDMSVAANAIAWTILTDGIPIIYQGQEQHLAGGDDPGSREAMWLAENGSYDNTSQLHNTTAYLNQIRTWTVQHSEGYTHYKNVVLNYSDTQIAIRKDVMRFILTFAGVGQPRGTYTTIGGGFSPNSSVVDVINCKAYTANSAGEVTADVGGGAIVVMMQADFIKGSEMCGY
ncbi:glycoside hydrolase family 13 protein [Zasmidium cellare ATCC 36951]|uniref:alpha-amylase n=1 Tax=Zasmidium cellare ATCC 36951 TaxID=1080233 RepID=A0A6A6CXY1_ZASCE|nr:glycoside hydrolase family 13 protein [Zasmidium cellare ATCC 36951]KAF2171951.1 glycoside hydrolase family 13 protein [Zasmidium cellare ATCC 36951]